VSSTVLLDDINALFSFPAILLGQSRVARLAINRTILIAWFMTLVAMTIFVLAVRNAQVVPGKLQSLVEMMIDFVREIAVDIIGPKGHRYVPILTTFFVFILFMNVAKITPFLMLPPTSRIAFPLFLAGITWLIYVGAGIKEQGFVHYFSGAAVPARGPQGALHHPDPDRDRLQPHPAAVHPHGPTVRQHGRRPHPRRHHPGDHPRLPAVLPGRLDGRA
jgi:F-type H+-transporting ATPase subunit a